MSTRLILIEGLPGSGKSTTAKFISSKLTEMSVAHQCYLESPDGGPVKFIWPEGPSFRDELVFGLLAVELFHTERLAGLGIDVDDHPGLA